MHTSATNCQCEACLEVRRLYPDDHIIAGMTANQCLRPVNFHKKTDPDAVKISSVQPPLATTHS
jgi:hypothetical protein